MNSMLPLNEQLTGVSRTMLLTLRARADEHQQLNPLFYDLKAIEWSQLLPWDKELDKFYSSAMQDGLAVRVNQFDRIAEQHIAIYSNHAIVVELGAGLSTRYYRIGQNCYWFELDLPEVGEIRRQLDSETEQHRFINNSVMNFSWMDVLPNSSPEAILFIAEGLLMYFEASEVRQLINVMCQRFAGATLIFDTMGNKCLRTRNISLLAQMTAPIKWFVNHERDVTEMGLSVLSITPLFQLVLERWGYLRWKTKLPGIFRNISLLFQTKIPVTDGHIETMLPCL